MSLDGSNPSSLIAGPGDQSEPDYSPDGAQIAYTGEEGGDEDILLASSSGGFLANLTAATTVNDSDPAFSRTGKQVAFSSARSGINLDVYTMAVDGSSQFPITVVSSADDTNPDFQPFHECFKQRANIVGTVGDDVLRGTNGPDVFVGFRGDDRILGRRGQDLICGGPGNDRLSGGSKKDKLFGEAGKDVLSGGNGPDKLVGDAGADKLRGGPGIDQLKGGGGKDKLKQ
jgi:Ca2+-binding RTX toxin-like protein